MPVKRNHGRMLGPRPLLLDRAKKARPVRVNRKRRFPVRSLTFALLLAVGGVFAYRNTSPNSLTTLLKAAQGSQAAPATQPSVKSILPPINMPSFLQEDPHPTLQPTPSTPKRPEPLSPPAPGPSSSTPTTHPAISHLPDAWNVLTTPGTQPPPPDSVNPHP